MLKNEISDGREEKSKPVILVEFSNGRLKPSKNSGLKYTCYKNAVENSTCNPKRILVAKSNRMCYTGTNYENDLLKSSVFKVCIFNKRNSSIEFYDADLFHLKPLLKRPVIEQSTETRSYFEMSSDLSLAFGSKAKIKSVNSKQKYGFTSANSASDSIDSLLAVAETAVEQKMDLSVPSKNNCVTVIPPQNNSANNVDEVYNLYDIVSKEVYTALDSEAETFLSAKYEDIQLWKKEDKYSAFIIQYVENTTLDHHKAKLLCYLHYMFCFLKTVYTDWRKKDPVPDVPQPFKQILMDSFTIKKSISQRMKDKLLAYSIVLGLILNNYVFNGTILASSVKMSLKRVVSVAYALGCHVSGKKDNDAKIIELKLPLYKFQAGVKLRKK